MLIDDIRSASITARKERDALRGNLLQTLFAEAAMVGKNAGNRTSTDEEVVATVRKFLKNAEETLRIVPPGSDAASKTQAEIEILKSFLPGQMSRGDLEAAIAALIARLPERTPKAMGAVMASLKSQYGGSYNAKLASELVKAGLA